MSKTSGKWWLNNENDLFWDRVKDQTPHWIDPVESFTIRFGGGIAKALLVVRMPNIEVIEKFQNGDSLIVVHNPCGRRGGTDYSNEDIRLVLQYCAVLDKGLDSLFTNDPQEVNVVGAWIKVRGTLRLYPSVNEDKQ